MRILHVIPGLNESSGPSQVVAKLSEFQAQQGAEVTICHVLGRGADPQRAFPENIRIQSFPAKWFRNWAYAPGLGRYLRKNISRYDIVHIHSLWLYPTFAAASAAKKREIPFLVRPAGSLEAWALGQARIKKWAYFSLVEGRILRAAARIHAVSRQEADQIEKLELGSKVLMVSNGIDLREFLMDSPRQELIGRIGIPEAAKYVLFLGRIHPVKGLDLLIEAFSALKTETLDVRLLVVGPVDHDYAREIRSLAERSQASARIHFLGELTGREKLGVLHLADVFALPSKSENFGIAILEALAAGTPALVSEHTPWPMLDERGAGQWLPRTSEAFTTAMGHILRLSSAEAVQMAESARSLAAEYSWEKVSKSLLLAYQEIISETAAADPT